MNNAQQACHNSENNTREVTQRDNRRANNCEHRQDDWHLRHRLRQAPRNFTRAVGLVGFTTPKHGPRRASMVPAPCTLTAGQYKVNHADALCAIKPTLVHRLSMGNVGAVNNFTLRHLCSPLPACIKPRFVKEGNTQRFSL